MKGIWSILQSHLNYHILSPQTEAFRAKHALILQNLIGITLKDVVMFAYKVKTSPLTFV